jgi:anti-sigma factor RsiW
MSCDLTGHLLDDYLDHQLSQRERQRLENHISVCARCAEELQERLALERALRQALTSAVQHLQLTPELSRRILWALDSSARQPMWYGYATRAAQIMAGVGVVILLLAGMFLLLGRVRTPSGVQQVGLPQVNRAFLSLDRGNIFVEPGTLHPGDLFTVTVPIDDRRLRPLEVLHCNLDIRGPSGRFGY